MARTDELEEMKTRYKIILGKGEQEPVPQAAGDGKTTWPINPASIAILVVGARLARILIDLGMIMAVMVREQRWLRLITQGEIEKVVKEQDANRNKPRIYVPGKVDALIVGG